MQLNKDIIKIFRMCFLPEQIKNIIRVRLVEEENYKNIVDKINTVEFVIKELNEKEIQVKGVCFSINYLDKIMRYTQDKYIKHEGGKYYFKSYNIQVLISYNLSDEQFFIIKE